MTKIIELRPDNSLLNNKFEKYKFSPDTVCITKEIQLKYEVFRLEPNNNQSSWLEARLFAFHNHLFKNPYDSSCWFVDENWLIWQLDKDGILNQIYELSSMKEKERIYNPSFGFLSDNIVIFLDGHKTMLLLMKDEARKTTFITLENVESGLILDVRYSKNKSLFIITICVITDISGKKYSQLLLLYYSYNICNTILENVVFLKKLVLKVQGAVDYVYVEENAEYLHSICQDTINFEGNNNNDHNSVEGIANLRIPKYYWSQDEETLTVWIKISEDDFKQNLKVNVTQTTISVLIDENIILQGQCQHCLDKYLTTWTYENDKLKLELVKSESGLMWNELILSDTNGECIPNDVLAREIHSKLAHLCTDQMESRTGEQPALGFNTEQLEECDIEGKENHLQRINFNTHKTTHLAILGSGNHVLFTCKSKSGQLVCLRHDNDACFWLFSQGDNEEWNFQHVHTFPGFGYVEASKTNKKFCVSPTDGSYIGIIEHTRHIFLYQRPELNGITGKQRIIDLGSEATPIMGAIATNKFLILLTKNKLYLLKMES
ncbi:nudC domain-containing protein 1 [Prorops nasuta]|uniref:nudC domain-containing protein 1 n=1 Tax=Prorops nasuta TaxID=863751 RepID=UPI0034CF28DF